MSQAHLEKRRKGGPFYVLTSHCRRHRWKMLRAVLEERKAVHVVFQSFRRWMTNSAGTGRRCAVMSFGDGSHGALGLPTSLTGVGTDSYEPTRVPGLPSDVTSVSAGHYHSLAVTSQGAVWAWGRDFEGQLGRGGPSPRY